MSSQCLSRDSSGTSYCCRSAYTCTVESWELCWNALEPHRASTVEITWTSPTT
jgi:hypothetical protein